MLEHVSAASLNASTRVRYARNVLTAEDERAFSTWLRQRDEGNATGLLGLYDLVATERGCRARDLPLTLRHTLAQRTNDVLWPNFKQVAPPRFDADIEVVPYRAEWAVRAEALCGTLRIALPTARVEHIGSTAILGLAAKPILDLMVSVDALEYEDGYRDACEALGTVLTTRDEQHRFFCAPLPHPRTLHVHVCARGGTFEREHLLFRDYLRTHGDDAQRYAEAKAQAAVTWGDDRFGYTDAKSVIIADVTERAEAWATKSGWHC